MSLNRYMLIGKEHSPTLTRIAEVKFSKILKLAVLFSFGVNLGPIWQYFINDGLYWILKFFTVATIGQIYDIYPQINRNNSIFCVYMFVYYFLNIFAFLVINTGIEIATVRKLQHELEEKRLKSAEMNKSLDESTKKKRLEEDSR
jgi:hypothetical protein